MLSIPGKLIDILLTQLYFVNSRDSEKVTWLMKDRKTGNRSAYFSLKQHLRNANKEYNNNFWIESNVENSDSK
jgi:hypothetical protein